MTNFVKLLEVPTGHIGVVKGDSGLLEIVSLGDYGKDVNIHSDFLGLDRPLDHVEHTDLLPLEEKWVVTISTQYGCSMGCKFCDVPKVGPGRNASLTDLVSQVSAAMSLHPEVNRSDRLNIHYARMGEPSWNAKNVLDSVPMLVDMYGDNFRIHPVVSTMMPKHCLELGSFLREWVWIKNRLMHGNAGLQLSINSTSDAERNYMFSGNSSSLEGIAWYMKGLKPEGRKFTLNFAVCDWEIDPDVLLKYFDPELYIVKLTPVHVTQASTKSGFATEEATTYSPYADFESSLTKAGYDVIVFIASHEEDAGLITCGNAILSGSTPTVPYKQVV